MADPTSAERQSAHRAGRSADFDRRFVQAARVPMFGPNGAGNIYRSDLPTVASAGTLLTSNRAYWVYLGRAARPITAAKVLFHVAAGGTGAQTAEVAIATSVAAPDRAAKSLTVVAKTGTLGDLTGTGVLGNTTSFAYQIAENTHVWVGIRTALATTQPELFGHTFDCANGEILITSSAGVLAVGTAYTGAIITAALTWQAPALFLSAV